MRAAAPTPTSGAITGRIGERFGKYFGVEGELSGGVKNDTDQTTGLKTSLDHQYAGYVVGYLPVLPNADLFVRAGYGNQKLREQGPAGSATIPKASTTGRADSTSSTPMTGCAQNTPARTTTTSDRTRTPFPSPTSESSSGGQRGRAQSDPRAPALSVKSLVSGWRCRPRCSQRRRPCAGRMRQAPEHRRCGLHE